MPFTLTSSAFDARAEIPSAYTCEGKDISPPLRWIDSPAGAKTFVLFVEDPDAPDPDAPKMTWTHWVLYNVPGNVDELREGAASTALPEGTMQGLNDWKRADYGGPCPPIGRHRYFHKLYALDIMLPDLGKATRAEIERAMQAHVIARAELIGTYQKKDK